MVGCEQNTIEPDPGNEEEMSSAESSMRSGRVSGPGSFSVLTYNVAGLPAFLSSGNPEENTGPIGQLIRDYDIVHVQEDFNYHATLYANDDHPHRTPTSGGIPFGDGLNTLSNFPYSDFQRIKWNDCNGTDCLTPKGFTVARIRITEGMYIDFYNAHPNAGSGEANWSARRSNITQLKNFINDFSKGNAVILMGDLNCRYTRSEDNVRELATLGLNDAWVELVKGGAAPAAGSPALVCDNDIRYGDAQCEIVDKILYRGNNYIKLTATAFSYEEDRFRDANGDMLSDHRPVYVDFDYELSDDLRLSDQFGGPHGDSFTDIGRIQGTPNVQSIFLRAGSRLDQVGITLGSGSGYVQLQNRGTDLYLDGMGRTNNGASCGQWAGTPSNNAQWALQPFDGSYYRLQNRGTGMFLDGLGYTSNGAVCGMWSNSTSDNAQWTLELFDGNYYRIQNRATGLYLDGMGRTSNGATAGQYANTGDPNAQWDVIGSLPVSHGGNGGTYQELTLQNGEYVTEVTLNSGKHNDRTRIFRAEFRTNLNRTLMGGSQTSNTVTYTAPSGWQIVGFHGRAGGEVDKLGVIYTPVP